MQNHHREYRPSPRNFHNSHVLLIWGTLRLIYPLARLPRTSVQTYPDPKLALEERGLHIHLHQRVHDLGRCEFVAIALNSVAADSLFTVSNILIASVFPAETQGLAAGVFNTVSQIGKSFGLATVALISNTITKDQEQISDKGSPEALMIGYRAAFWALFGMNVGSFLVNVVGLRKIGNIGKKKKSQ